MIRQSAYKAHHSTETAVLKVLGDILRAIDSGDLALLTIFFAGCRLIFMVAHNPSAVALPLLPLVLCCVASLRVRFLDRSSFFSIPLIFCNWSSIMVCIRIHTSTTHRFMVSVSLATQPGYRVSCRRVYAMLHHECSVIASSLTRPSRKSSSARRSADSIWSQTRHLSLALLPSYQPAVSATSASISTSTCISTSARLHQAVSVFCVRSAIFVGQSAYLFFCPLSSPWCLPD